MRLFRDSRQYVIRGLVWHHPRDHTLVALPPCSFSGSFLHSQGTSNNDTLPEAVTTKLSMEKHVIVRHQGLTPSPFFQHR